MVFLKQICCKHMKNENKEPLDVAYAFVYSHNMKIILCKVFMLQQLLKKKMV